jgi:hypothetical protein
MLKQAEKEVNILDLTYKTVGWQTSIGFCRGMISPTRWGKYYLLILQDEISRKTMDKLYRYKHVVYNPEKPGWVFVVLKEADGFRLNYYDGYPEYQTIPMD